MRVIPNIITKGKWQMNICKPYRSGVQAVFIIAFTTAFTLISCLCMGFYPDMVWGFRIVGAVFLFAGFGLLYRFSVTEFEYCLEGDFFSVRRFNGIKWRTAFSLKLTADTVITTDKKQCKKLKGVSHRQNLSAACAYLIYEQAGKKKYMEFEPNRIFYKIVRDKLNEKK